MEATVRDLLGEPKTWVNQISDAMDWMPNMSEATILDVFVAGNQIAVYTRSAEGVQALSVFFVDDEGLRNRVAGALSPGLKVQEVLSRSI